MPEETQSQKVRKRLRRLKRQQVVAETALARIKKKQRSAEAHGKYLLGALADLADWGKPDIATAEKRISKISEMLSHAEKTSEFRETGELIFLKAKKDKAFKKKRESFAPESWKEEVHYRITIGGIWVKYGLGAESKAVLLGAMVAMNPKPDSA